MTLNLHLKTLDVFSNPVRSIYRMLAQATSAGLNPIQDASARILFAIFQV